MKMRFVMFWALALTFVLQAQDPAQKYAGLVTVADLKDNLTILASDALEGRATGTRGQKMAAAFIAAHFESLGLAGPVNGSYYQPLTLYAASAPDVMLQMNGVALKANEEFIYFGSGSTNGKESLSAVYVGYATDADLQQVDVKGKIAVVNLDAGASLRNNPALSKLRDKEAVMVMVVMEKVDEYENIASQIRNFTGSRMSLTKSSPSSTLGTFIITQQTLAKIFKTDAAKLNKAVTDKSLAKVKPASLEFSVIHKNREVKTENILGYLEGTDKKDEVIVVTAHYDHVGKRANGTGDLINNGADDDGSGTVAVMAMAKAFAQAKAEGNGPRRSILFMTVTAEEVGLLGSQYYADINPVFPLDKTVVNLNIDMIGRRDPQHKDSPPYVYVIGSDKLSTELHKLSEDVNSKTTKLVFDYTYNDQNHPDRLYYRSDHWNFAKNNIPIIFYFDGIHEDYHQPSDEVDKIEFDLLETRTRCAFYTAWEIANRDQRIMPDKK